MFLSTVISEFYLWLLCSAAPSLSGYSKSLKWVTPHSDGSLLTDSRWKKSKVKTKNSGRSFWVFTGEGGQHSPWSFQWIPHSPPMPLLHPQKKGGQTGMALPACTGNEWRVQPASSLRAMNACVASNETRRHMRLHRVQNKTREQAWMKTWLIKKTVSPLPLVCWIAQLCNRRSLR